MKKLWIVGHYLAEDKKNEAITWRFCGVYSSKKQAVTVALRIHQDCFVAPAIVDEESGATPEPQPWPGSWYPALMDEPKES